MKRFVVASASPRRKELLQLQGFTFEVIPSDCDERVKDGLSPKETVMALAKLKAESVFLKNTDAVILGCDTIVELDGKILGKPFDRSDAVKMLSELSGKKHNVHTGVCIKSREKCECFVSTAKVEFYENSTGLIKSYVASGESDDKAGAYGIQGLGSALVKSIEGDYFTVVGLPLAQTVRELNKFEIHGKLFL